MKKRPRLILTSLWVLLASAYCASAQQTRPRFGFGSDPATPAKTTPKPKPKPTTTPPAAKQVSSAKPKPKAKPVTPAKPDKPDTAVAKKSSTDGGAASTRKKPEAVAENKAKAKPTAAKKTSEKSEVAKNSEKAKDKPVSPANRKAATPEVAKSTKPASKPSARPAETKAAPAKTVVASRPASRTGSDTRPAPANLPLAVASPSPTAASAVQTAGIQFFGAGLRIPLTASADFAFGAPGSSPSSVPDRALAGYPDESLSPANPISDSVSMPAVAVTPAAPVSQQTVFVPAISPKRATGHSFEPAVSTSEASRTESQSSRFTYEEPARPPVSPAEPDAATLAAELAKNDPHVREIGEDPTPSVSGSRETPLPAPASAPAAISTPVAAEPATDASAIALEPATADKAASPESGSSPEPSLSLNPEPASTTLVGSSVMEPVSDQDPILVAAEPGSQNAPEENARTAAHARSSSTSSDPEAPLPKSAPEPVAKSELPPEEESPEPASGDPNDLSEREREFVRSLAEAAGNIRTTRSDLSTGSVSTVATAAKALIREIPRDAIPELKKKASDARDSMQSAARALAPELPMEIESDLMPSTPEKMPDSLPAFDAGSKGKIDVQSDRQADYDQANNRVIFTGKVELNSAAIRLRAERVEVYMKKGGGGMDRVEASGNVLMRTQDTANGPGQMASAGRASYNLRTGEITLSGWPKIQESSKSHISTDASTKMYMFTDGRLRTDGPNRTILGGE